MVPDDLKTICFSICEVKWKNIRWNFRTEKLINWYDYYFFVCGCLFATFHIEKVIASKQMFPVSLALTKKEGHHSAVFCPSTDKSECNKMKLVTYG